MNKSRKFAAFGAILFLITVFNVRVSGQQYDDDGNIKRIFYAGFVGGANFTQVDGDNFAGFRKIGINVGAIGYIQLREHVALSWEILLSQKGSKSDIIRHPQPGAGIDSLYINKYSISVNYAEVPVMINYFDKRKSHFGLGVSFGRLVSSAEHLETDPAYNVDFTKYPFNKNTFEFVAGAQLHLVKGLFLNIRYQYSILPIRTNSPPGLYRSDEYNNLWSVRFMYLFI